MVDLMYDTDKIFRKIGYSIYIIRKELKITAKELGNQVGKSECTVTAWERGEHIPSFSSVLKVCNVFNCSIEELFNAEEYIKIKKAV